MTTIIMMFCICVAGDSDPPADAHLGPGPPHHGRLLQPGLQHRGGGGGTRQGERQDQQV